MRHHHRSKFLSRACSSYARGRSARGICARGFNVRGFTLLEMLVVVVILGIGLAAALPKIQTLTMRQRVDRTTYIVASDMRSAFTSSARGRIPVRVRIPGDTTRYTVTNTVTGDTILKRDFASDHVRVSGQASHAVTMSVYPNGVATGMDTLVVGTSSYSRRISVTRVGFVRVLP